MLSELCTNCGHARDHHYKWIKHHDEQVRDTLGCAIFDCLCEEFEAEEVTDDPNGDTDDNEGD